MLKLMPKLGNSNTVAGILSTFTKAVKDLQNLSVTQNDLAELHNQHAKQLLVQVTECRNEGAKAARVAEKIQELLEV